jgi:hypothetical protein
MIRVGYTRKLPPRGGMRSGPALVASAEGVVVHVPPVLWAEANPSAGSLDVVQQPQRARMCGFGDKVRLSFVLLVLGVLRRRDGSQPDRTAGPSPLRPA